MAAAHPNNTNNHAADIFLPMEEAIISDESQLYTHTQNRILSTIPVVLGSLSLLGSSLLLYVILQDHRKPLRRNSYDRIIFGLSFFDVLASSGFTFFGPWTTSEADAATFVVGARASSGIPCEVAGFLNHMIVGSILYSAALSIYFVLLVRLEWRPERIAMQVEPWMHAVSIGAAFSTGVYAVVNGFMNPNQYMPGICWVGGFPPICEFSEVECSRGNGSLRFIRGIAALPLFTISVVVLAMILLIHKVRVTEQRMAQYQIEQQRPSGAAATSNSNISYERTRRTTARGLAYITTFVISLVIPSIFLFIFIQYPPTHRPTAFLVALVIVTCVPLQGLFNAVIYLQPKFSELSKPGGSLEWLGRSGCLGRLVYGGVGTSPRGAGNNNNPVPSLRLASLITHPGGGATTAHNDAPTGERGPYRVNSSSSKILDSKGSLHNTSSDGGATTSTMIALRMAKQRDERGAELPSADSSGTNIDDDNNTTSAGGTSADRVDDDRATDIRLSSGALRNHQQPEEEEKFLQEFDSNHG